MSRNIEEGGTASQIESELYFLIARFLTTGPCKKAAEVLKRELAENKLLPKRIDWEGTEHQRSFENLIELHRHVSADHLKKICQRLGPLLDKEIKPSVTGVQSLLGAGRQSLLRTHEGLKHVRWKGPTFAVLSHNRPLLPPTNFAHPSRLSHVLRAQEFIGPHRSDFSLPSQLYNKVSMHSRKLGHLSAVYCVAFDRTGEYIFTGADDHLVKIWCAMNCRLLATLRGHSGEITDMAVNYENTILATGSCDKCIRVWCLRTKAPVSVLHAHTGHITSLQFCPLVRGETRYLVSTGADGCVCFWHLNRQTYKFNPKPIKFIERSRAGAQMLCSSFSPGGIFLATGNSDNVIRVYCFTSAVPEKVCELEAHLDRVDSMEYANHGDRFLSGSGDGTARIWRFERQEWRNIVLNMAEKLVKPTPNQPEEKTKYKLTMLCWNLDDSRVVTAVSDFTLKVWDSRSGKLVHIMEGHEDEIFVLEHSPVDPRIVLSAGHDGKVIIWDIFRGIKIKSFYNMIEGQGHGAVFDCKFTPDGQSFAATDSHGFLLLFGFGSNEKYKLIPDEVFFHTDYRPLIRDANDYVLDEQTQQAPHLMAPPFLVDIDGNPYPPGVQKLVPGRETCSSTQLVPQLAVNEDGDQEVVGEVPGQEVVLPTIEEEGERPELDVMIRLMQQQQDQRLAVERGEPVGEALASPPPMGSPRARSASARGVGMRRSGETEGVRQSLENVAQTATQSQLAELRHRVVVKGVGLATLRKSEEFRTAMAEKELKKFVTERKKKPTHGEGLAGSSGGPVNNRHKQRALVGPTEETGRNRLTTRALYDTEEEEEEEDESSQEDMWDSEKTGGSESSEYSDWMGDQGSNLQPPKRFSQRQRKKKKFTSSESEGSNTEVDIDGEEEEDPKPPHKETQQPRRPQRKKQHQKKKQMINNVNCIEELPEEFRPPEWLTDTIPRKAPYVSQMGDEVIYFRQGHELYLQAVKRHKIYNLNINKSQPWHKHANLREHECVKIVGIKYEIKPPRLCCLKLALIDAITGKHAGGTFSIKYHDMPDVIDFLVLKQNYDTATRRKWKVGDRFRSMIDDAWWMGEIQAQEPFQEEYPDSMFQCFVVHWDNGEFEKLSPWDMEPIDDDKLPASVGGGVSVTQEELKSLMYTPKSAEWPRCGRDEECERIIKGLEDIMEHSIAEPFLTPVDLNAFPTYGIIIEYPMDLSTIKARLDNHFYRRVNAVQFDIRYLEINANTFNEPGSQIVRSARMLSETLLRFISTHSCIDSLSLLNELSQGEEFRWDKHESEMDSEESTGRKKKQGERSRGSTKRRKSEPVRNPNAWKEECHDLLQTMFQCQDSEPFRNPVDPDDYPDYQELIGEPMDLRTVQVNMDADSYDTPTEFCKDIRMIFQNSRAYNTNKRSRIYTMTLRLSAMFDEHMKEILAKWKLAMKQKRGKSSATAKNKSRPKSQGTADSMILSPSSSVNQSTTSRSTNQPAALNNHSNSQMSSPPPKDKADSSREESSGSTTEIEGEVTPARNTKKSVLTRKSTSSSAKPASLTNGHSPVSRYATRSASGTRKRKKLTSSDNSSASNSSSNSDTEIEGATVDKRRPKRKQTVKRSRKSERRKSSSSSDSSNLDSGSSGSESSDESGGKEQEEQVRRSKRSATQKSSASTANRRGAGGDFNGHANKRQRIATGHEGEVTEEDNGDEGMDEDDENDEDYVVEESSKKKASSRKSPRTSSNRRTSYGENRDSDSNHRTRNRGKRTVTYEEDSEDESGQSDNSKNHVTMSSRGRLRRLTPRARASLLGE